MQMISKRKKLYGFEIIEKLEAMGLSVKEGTLYPLLSRMARDKVLETEWQTEGNKGHPRKYYHLTSRGSRLLLSMKSEFESMVKHLNKI